MGLIVGLILIVIVLILIFLLKSGEKTPYVKEAPKALSVARSTTTADDLKAIEGIGPKIAALFAEKGYSTYAALAKADPKVLDEVLREASLAMADPATWPQQAKLLAEGKLDELAVLQDSLKGGRKV